MSDEGMTPHEWLGNCDGCGRQVRVVERGAAGTLAALEDHIRGVDGPLLLVGDAPLGAASFHCPGCGKLLPVS